MEEPGMRRDIEINAEGATLRGWLYLPDRAPATVPAVVMAHGFSAVKEMYLDRYAEVFAAAGLAVVVFDNRNFGASSGEPRYEIDPWQQVRDYRHVITWVRQQPGIDRDRIGVWGSSYSGGHVLVLGAIDRRIKCLVSQVPLVSGSRNLKRLVRADMFAALREQFDADREARFNGAPPTMIPVVSEDPLGPAALPTADSWSWFTETGRARAHAWHNQVTLRTVEMLSEYEPGSYIDRISPTPLLMIIADGDHLAVADEAFAAYNRALEPKRLLVLRGGHFDAYIRDFAASSNAARDWFATHLR
ncbi:MAG TPA: alpha/beta hydrolase [Candidatus Binataceae bacterium]|nr:alpha/beta hydrolase [Candidatus Binataceae bacterium]